MNTENYEKHDSIRKLELELRKEKLKEWIEDLKNIINDHKKNYEKIDYPELKEEMKEVITKTENLMFGYEEELKKLK